MPAEEIEILVGLPSRGLFTFRRGRHRAAGSSWSPGAKVFLCLATASSLRALRRVGCGNEFVRVCHGPQAIVGCFKVYDCGEASGKATGRDSETEPGAGRGPPKAGGLFQPGREQLQFRQ